eukprot:2011616-Prymnesium_polylepis.3
MLLTTTRACSVCMRAGAKVSATSLGREHLFSSVAMCSCSRKPLRALRSLRSSWNASAQAKWGQE